MPMLSSDVWLRRVSASQGPESCLRQQSRLRQPDAPAEYSSRHAAGQEAADRNPMRAFDRPDHGSAGAVRLGDNSIIGDVDPFVIETDAIMAFAGFPIDVG